MSANLLFGWLAFLGAASASAQTFVLDPKQSELVVKVFKAGFAASLAHNHVVKATEVSGELSWDPAAPEATRVEVTVEVAGLVADRPAVRKRHGEPSELSPGDQRKVTEAMLGEGQLDLRRFPTIRFVSTGMERGGLITGKLTLHGVTREVRVPVKIEAKGEQVVGDGRLRLKVSDYRIEPYRAALGAIRNQDEVELVLHLVGTPRR